MRAQLTRVKLRVTTLSVLARDDRFSELWNRHQAL